jgi:hypothetical protein
VQSTSEWVEPPLEIGKRNVLEDNRLGLCAFRNNLAFFGIDTGTFTGETPLTGPWLREVTHDLREALQALPYTAYDLASAESAFRLTAQAKHTGKIHIDSG